MAAVSRFLASRAQDAATPSRQVVCRYVDAPGPRPAVRQNVEQVLATHAEIVAGMDTTLSDPPHSLLLTAADRTFLLDIEGTGQDQVLYLPAATHDGPEWWRVVESIVTALDAKLRSP
jgi:hypothetical protein